MPVSEDKLPQAASPIPEALNVPKRRWAVNIVWLIPLVAALVGGWVAIHYLMQRGPTVTIEFANADGLEAGKTKLRYKEVDIGTVSAIAIAKDRSHVIVTAKMAKQAEDLLVADTKFWVVRPRVTLNSISGLGTLLSGAYIGLDAGKSEEEKWDFKGLETPPPIPSDLPGRRFKLHADDIGSLYVGAPVYYRRVEVGSITAYKLDENGKGITLEVFVNAPHDRLVTTNARFWHASGIDVSIESSGVKLNTESLTSIIVGGISFQAPEETAAGDPALADTMFPLYDNKASALKLISREVHSYVLYFDESLRGLAPGAQVDFRGIPLGEVKSVSIEYDREDKVVRFPVEIDIYPERMRARYRPGAPEMSAMERNPQQLLDRMVARGFRAQLKSANLLTGQLYVALDFFPKAPKAKIDWNKQPVELPTAPGALEDIQQTLGNIAGKLEKVPFDTIGNDLSRALKTLDTTLKSANSTLKQVDSSVVPELRGTLESARKALGNAERTLASDAPVQSDLRDTLTEVSRAARTLQDLADYLSRHPESLIRGKKGD
ncbi:PqiB family protein [Noviherbaspirillum soli]|uniref:PqiB family protein n=1 Tax=Noviherbaspirillum soli TaxID=1064518 RepID=UPI00188CB032